MLKILTMIVFLVVPYGCAAHGEGVWTVYTAGDDINSLAVGGDYVWCAAEGSVVRWNTGTMSPTQHSYADGLYLDDMKVIAADEAGRAWVSSDESSNVNTVYNGEKWSSLGIDLKLKQTLAMYCDSDDNLWIGTNGKGLVYTAGDSFEISVPNEGLNYVRDIAVDHDGVVWFATTRGVWCLKDNTLRYYTVEDSLPTDSVRCVFIGHDNVKWFGTIDGLVRYDGQTWKTYTRKDGLINNRINAIAREKSGVLWIATEGGISRYDGFSWTSYTSDDDLMDDRVSDIAVGSDGTVWACYAHAEKGVTALKNGEWVWYTRWDSNPVPYNTMECVAAGPDSTIWFGCAEGLVYFDGSSWGKYTTADGLAADSVSDVVVGENGSLWIVHPKETHAGITRFEGGSWRTFTPADGLPDDSCSAFFQETDGTTWFASFKGVFSSDGVSWVQHEDYDRLMSPMIYDIAEGPDECKWFATAKGLTRYDGTLWKTLTEGDGLMPDEFKRVTVGSDGIVWIVTGGGELASYDGAAFTVHPPPVDSGVTAFTEIAAYRDGSVICITDRYDIYQYDSGGWIDLTPGIEPLSYAIFRDVAVDADGMVWFATNSGLARFDGETWRIFTVNAPIHNQLNELAVDQDNVLWCATYRGISSFDGTTWKVYRGPVFNTGGDGERVPLSVTRAAVDRDNVKWFVAWDDNMFCSILSYDGVSWETYDSGSTGMDLIDIVDVTVDDDNIKWFTTLKSGVIRFDGTSWESFTKADGLALDTVSQIIVDRNSTRWFLSENSGISSFDGETWKYYTVEDGFFSNKITGVDRDSAGRIWFSSQDNGAACYDGMNATVFTTENGLFSDNVYCIYIDGQDTVWAGMFMNFMSFDGSAWVSHMDDIQVRFFGGSITSINADNYGTIWFYGFLFTLVSFDGLSWATYDLGPISRSVYRTDIIDYNNTKWYVTSGSLISYDDRGNEGNGTSPKPVRLIGSYPNPFNTATTVEFELRTWGRVDLSVYNILGQRVRQMQSPVLPVGINSFVWDGTDDGGSRVSSGPYFYRLGKGNHAVDGRMMFVK